MLRRVAGTSQALSKREPFIFYRQESTGVRGGAGVGDRQGSGPWKDTLPTPEPSGWRSNQEEPTPQGSWASCCCPRSFSLSGEDGAHLRALLQKPALLD